MADRLTDMAAVLSGLFWLSSEYTMSCRCVAHETRVSNPPATHLQPHKCGNSFDNCTLQVAMSSGLFATTQLCHSSCFPTYVLHEPPVLNTAAAICDKAFSTLSTLCSFRINNVLLPVVQDVFGCFGILLFLMQM